MVGTTVACVLRNSAEYGPEDVAALRDGVAKHLENHRFVCLSDVEVPCDRIPLQYLWPGWWAKMELFRSDIEGDLLYFDLDTVIVGDLSDIARVKKLTALTSFYDDRMGSGMMFLPETERPEVWEMWMMHEEYRAGGDQEFLEEVWGNRAARWQDELPGQVISYKCHVLPNSRVPDNARVVCFHGQPKPRNDHRFFIPEDR